MEEFSSTPIYGVSERTTPEGSFGIAIESALASLECCMPARVEKYDRATHMAIVQPLVNLRSNLSDQIKRMPIRVSVLRNWAGKFVVDAPLEVGDTGWIIASDRATNGVKAYNPEIKDKSKNDLTNDNMAGPQPNNCYLTHIYADGFFIPDRWNKYTLEKDDVDNKRFVLQSVDGKERISIGQEDIKVYSINSEENKDKERTEITIGNGKTSFLASSEDESDTTQVKIDKSKVYFSVSSEGQMGEIDETTAEIDKSKVTLNVSNNEEKFTKAEIDKSKVDIEVNDNGNTTTAQIDGAKITINSNAGNGKTTKIEIKDGIVSISTSNKVDIECDEINMKGKSGNTTVNIDGDLNVSGDTKVEGDTTLEGDAAIGGAADITGNANFAAQINNANKVDLAQHIHMTDVGPSGPPISGGV